MSTTLERFQNSPAWDKRYDLPLCSGLNNPWLYCAYAASLMRIDATLPLHAMLDHHFVMCENAAIGDDWIPGLFLRWPDGSGGQNSHDEIIGAAYLSPWIARRIYDYLESTKGYFNPAHEPGGYWRWNVYRMLYLRPYLQACCPGTSPGLFGQFIWGVSAILGILTCPKGEVGGVLRNGLMREKVQMYWLSRRMGNLWAWLANKRGMGPKYCYGIEPKEFPVYAECAGERWS